LLANRSLARERSAPAARRCRAAAGFIRLSSRRCLQSCCSPSSGRCSAAAWAPPPRPRAAASSLSRGSELARWPAGRVWSAPRAVWVWLKPCPGAGAGAAAGGQGPAGHAPSSALRRPGAAGAPAKTGRSCFRVAAHDSFLNAAGQGSTRLSPSSAAVAAAFGLGSGRSSRPKLELGRCAAAAPAASSRAALPAVRQSRVRAAAAQFASGAGRSSKTRVVAKDVAEHVGVDGLKRESAPAPGPPVPPLPTSRLCRPGPLQGPLQRAAFARWTALRGIC